MSGVMSGMMHVYLLRHGDAASVAPDGTYDDDRRELTPSGIEQLRTACSVYARMIEPPEQIMHSPLIRARQSAEILLTATAPAPGQEDLLTETGELRPGGRASRVIDMLQAEFLNGRESIVLVGHEPLLGDLLGMLTSGNDRFSLPMGKGMLAAIRMTDPQVMIGRMMAMIHQPGALRLAVAQIPPP